MDFTWYERQIRVIHKIRYILVLHLVFQAKKNFLSTREREFPHTQQHTRAREREKETDRQTTKIEKTKS